MGEPFTPFLLGALGHSALAFAAIVAATFLLEDPATVATALLAADGAIAPALAISPVQTGWFSDTAVQGYDIASKLAPTGRSQSRSPDGGAAGIRGGRYPVPDSGCACIRATCPWS